MRVINESLNWGSFHKHAAEFPRIQNICSNELKDLWEVVCQFSITAQKLSNDVERQIKYSLSCFSGQLTHAQSPPLFPKSKYRMLGENRTMKPVIEEAVRYSFLSPRYLKSSNELTIRGNMSGRILNAHVNDRNEEKVFQTDPTLAEQQENISRVNPFLVSLRDYLPFSKVGNSNQIKRRATFSCTEQSRERYADSVIKEKRSFHAIELDGIGRLSG